MEQRKRFKKKELKREDYKGAEIGATVLKATLGGIGAIGLAILNKDNLKTITQSLLKK